MEDVLIHTNSIYKKFPRTLRNGMLTQLRGWANPTSRTQLYNDEFWALKNISLQVQRGEILGVIGRNGSGKTTLMRILSGIFLADSGSVEIKGIVSSIFALKSGMQPNFSGRENVFLKAAMLGMSRKEIESKLDFIVSFSELESFLDTPIGMYSSGMRARLAFAVAIAVDPDIFIIDEGLAVGDAYFKQKCYDFLLSKRSKMAMVFVSNNQDKIMNLCSRIIVLENGEIVCNESNVNEGMNFYLHQILKLEEKA